MVATETRYQGVLTVWNGRGLASGQAASTVPSRAEVRGQRSSGIALELGLRTACRRGGSALLDGCFGGHTVAYRHESRPTRAAGWIPASQLLRGHYGAV